MKETPLQDEKLFDTKVYKIRKNYTIDSEIARDYDKYAEKIGLNKSNKITELIEDFLISEGVRPKKKT